MIETLFKAKRVDNGEWVEGSLLMSEIDVNELDVKCAIVERFANSYDIKRYEVIPETVCQFTGLTDKNGKNIWYGDCFIDSAGNTIVVTWRQDLASFALESEKWAYDHYFGEAVDAGRIEIVGNKFDNPELLK